MTNNDPSSSVADGVTACDSDVNEYVEGEDLAISQENKCGLGNCQPTWLQRFANKNTFVLVLGFMGLASQSVGAYNNASLSTLEKRFKIPSKTTGFIFSLWDVGELMSLLVMGYWGGRGHKPRFLAMGSFLIAASCIVRLMIHVVYGPGNDALSLTKEYGDLNAVLNASSTQEKGVLCGDDHSLLDEDGCNSGEGSFSVPTLLLAITSMCFGIGTSPFFVLGFAYIDDNTRKNESPLALAVSMCIRLVGPALGFAFATFTLAIYVKPSATPLIGLDDTRWIGAWWIGWMPGAALLAASASLMLLFPKRLPREAQRRVRASRPQDVASQASASIKDFKDTLLRLFRKPVFTLNSFSGVFFALGYVGYGVFLPKYMETQYRQSASSASFISGAVGLICTGLGVLASGFVASRWRPSARALAAWSVLVEVLDVVGHFTWAFLTCGENDLHGSTAPDGTWDLTAPCNAACECSPATVRYEPVCSALAATSFYSPCHAGCATALSYANGTTLYSECACSPNGLVDLGACPRDCGNNFVLFLATQCAMRFLESSGLAGNWLIQFRCVDESDKAMSIAVSEFMLAVFAFVPGIIFYGFLLDSTCLVWGERCGGSGNCWLYDDKKLRYQLNFTAAACLFCGMMLDIGVWYYSKDLKIYDEDFTEETSQNKDKDDPNILMINM